MKVSIDCINLIKESEGFKSKPYLCPAGIPTIGYGSTLYENGKAIKLTDPAITEQRAVELLYNTLKTYEVGVNTVTSGVELNQHQFDALVDFAYNLGTNALKKSTLLKKIKVNPNDPTIANEFRKWVKGGGKTLPGLVKRRDKEVILYFKK